MEMELTYSKNSQTLFVLFKFAKINYNQISDILKY